jgi:hypothetical protein
MNAMVCTPVPRSKQRIVIGIVALTIIAFAAVVCAQTTDSRTASAAPIRIDVSSDGSRLVTLIDPHSSPAVTAQALTAAGIRHETVGLMTGPSRVGTIVSISVDRELQLNVAEKPNRITLPAGYDGNVVLTVGIATPTGQQYRTPIDPFAHGEPLAGFADVHSAAAVAAAAKANGLAVIVLGADGEPTTDANLNDATIVVVFMMSADTLTVRID